MSKKGKCLMEKPLQEDNNFQKPVEGYFSGLRSLARHLDGEITSLGQKVENLQHSDFVSSHENDGTYAKHFMQLACKDMKTLKVDVRNIHNNLVNQSATIIDASELFTALLDNYSERLDSVESFMEKYGYVRPDLVTKEESFTNSSSFSVNPTEVLTPHAASTPTDVPDDVNGDKNQDLSSPEMTAINTPPSEMKEPTHKQTPRTPRLEDFGLSDYTITHFSQNFRSRSGTKNKRLFGQFEQLHSINTTGTDDDKEINKMHTPVCLEPKEPSKTPSPKMHTPQPEDFGLSGKFVSRERQVENLDQIPLSSKRFFKDERTCINYETFRDSHLIPANDMLTPNCKSVVNHDLSHTYTSSTVKGMNRNKENLSPEGTRSPKTPEMPKLLTGHWQEPAHYPQYMTEPTIVTEASESNTPELPRLHYQDNFDFNSISADCPPDVSLLPTTEQTPPLPVLASKRYYND